MVVHDGLIDHRGGTIDVCMIVGGGMHTVLPLLLAMLRFLAPVELHVHQQNLLQAFQRVEYFNATTTVESGWFEQPHITFLFGVARVQNWLGERVGLTLDFRILPTHITQELLDKCADLLVGVCATVGSGCSRCGFRTLAWLVSQKEVQKLLEVILAVLIIEVYEEGDGSKTKQLDLPTFTVDLEITDEPILGGDLVMALEVVDEFAYVEAGHLLVAEVLDMG
jgi:hypothetical protein